MCFKKIFWLLFLFFSPLYSTEPDLPDYWYCPKICCNECFVKHRLYTLCYNEKYEQAEWVCYTLSKEILSFPSVKRSNDFRIDHLVKTGSAISRDYKGSGFDRGHLAPAADMSYDESVMSESFYMSNMSPQHPGFNRGIWKKLEEQVRIWAVQEDEIIVITGPVLSGITSYIGSNKVGVPEYFYKVIIDKEPEFKVIAFILKNEPSKLSLSNFTVSVDSLERLTGLDFLPDYKPREQNILEALILAEKWSWGGPRRQVRSSCLH